MSQTYIEDYFGRKVREIPLVICSLIMQYLPTTDRLFLEQRLRYLQKDRLDGDEVESYNLFGSDRVTFLRTVFKCNLLHEKHILKPNCETVEVPKLRIKISTTLICERIREFGQVEYNPCWNNEDLIETRVMRLDKNLLDDVYYFLKSTKSLVKKINPKIVPEMSDSPIWVWDHIPYKEIKTLRYDNKSVFHEPPESARQLRCWLTRM